MKEQTIAVSVKSLKKDFVLPHERYTSIKERVLSFKKPTYEKFHALKNINLQIKKGEFVGIVGRNGSGKSTLLKILGGIYQPTAGEVKVEGTLTPFIELGIGFNPELTGRENVFLNGAILGLTHKQVKNKYQEIVDFAELEKFMDQKLKNYSSGMQVRLAFSIAIQAHNDILLIDEVLAVGDADFQKKCATIFKEIKDSDKTVIFVSHDMGAIKEYCNRAFLIEGGNIISEGDPELVANDYTQLFNKDAGIRSVGETRWGDRMAEISDITTKVNKTTLTISYKFTAQQQDIKNAILGLIIRDAANNHLFDTNTKWKKINTSILKKGKTVKVSWDIPNVLQAGQYSVSVAAAHEDGFTFYDWQDKAVLFDVTRNNATAGMLVLDDKINIKKV
jgi:ABC-2 type transport system ATP-binding protein